MGRILPFLDACKGPISLEKPRENDKDNDLSFYLMLYIHS
jgi:hypothetical protein